MKKDRGSWTGERIYVDTFKRSNQAYEEAAKLNNQINKLDPLTRVEYEVLEIKL